MPNNESKIQKLKQSVYDNSRTTVVVIKLVTVQTTKWLWTIVVEHIR